MITTILESFDIWTRSQTIKSNGRTAGVDNQRLLGIDKLRELILELAVRGKLVPQDEKDEPASELLKKIVKEKLRLFKDGKIKESKISAGNSGIDSSLELPDGWEINKLGNYTYIEMGQSPASISYNQEKVGIPFFQGKADFGDLNPIPRNWCTQPIKYSFPGDILLSVRAPVGPTNLANNECCIGRGLAAIRPLSESSSEYILYFIRSSKRKLEALATGTTFAAISKSDIEQFQIPIPPLAEQHRIVAKVDELMALCDQLEQQQTESNATHHQLVELLLQNLTEATGPEAFATAWQRIATNFDTLFNTEYSIDQLKQTILQLAVMGKLVLQDPKDEPASELLKKIAKEKEKLVKEGKIKKQEKLPEITEEEKPFELPRGWEWTKCLEICLKITDGEHATPMRSSSGYYLLSARNVTNEGIILDDVDFVPLDEFERIRKRCDPNIGDILISCSGSVGRVALVDKDNAYSMVRSAAMIRPEPNFLLKEYLVYLIRSPFLQFQIIKKSRQTAQANIFLGSISNLVFTIPPLAEQHRIVAKVDELFALCDALKERIKEAQETQGKLAEGVVEGVLG